MTSAIDMVSMAILMGATFVARSFSGDKQQLVPLIKAALLVPIFALRGTATSYRLYGVVQTMSKWSMADVFAVGMLIALLVGKGTANLSAVAGTGFYCFAAYCLVSNAAFQALKIEPPTPVAPTSSATTSSPFSARS